MRFNLLFFSFLCLLIVGCKTDTQNVEIESTLSDKQSKTITKNEIKSLKYNDFGLSDDAKEAVYDWQKYQELNTQMNYLKAADLSFFKSDISLITTFISAFRVEIPKSINTNEINARITALETKMLKLNSLLSLDNILKDIQLEALREVFVAFSNLNLQINKKLEFEANNILKPE
ncbi:hypothetical protein [Psychroserpens ponticola]|uniref:Lipoprotein n=1 Tax=Psychroserpens ponticola TaxID=2932268 RepID=A0ABY7RWS5_9FLAO|nr:hypothetical protein [Psychroserpens ponticola]WCO01537.1 hypothetical protein MUN68_015905 [Psychroserpens ponticola]